MQPAHWDFEGDLVVIGAGLAGYCAALEASEHAARVLLLEKLPEVGGTSRMSGGLFAFAGTDLQRKMGIVDSNECLFDDLRKVGNLENDESVVREYVDHQLDTYHWLRERGVVFGSPVASGGQSVPRSHTSNSNAVIETLSHAAGSSKHIRLMAETHAARLLTSPEGIVNGVLAHHRGKSVAIRAGAGVVLASGGFSRNQKLLRLFAPAQKSVNTVCGKACDGDGLLMAWKLGADLRDMAYVKSTFGNHPQAGSETHRVTLAVYRGAIAVNREAKRFVNESLSYKLLGDACLRQPDGLAFQIFDETVMNTSSPGVVTFDFQEVLDQGYLLKAATIEELAVKAKLSPVVLSATVKEYNRRLEAGLEDEYGRTSLSNGLGVPTPLVKPPFYAYPSVNVLLGTYCGIAINHRMQVVDVFDQPIDGLYAAGEVHGSFHGVAYMTGSGLGKAAIFGRLAARNALTAAKTTSI